MEEYDGGGCGSGEVKQRRMRAGETAMMMLVMCCRAVCRGNVGCGESRTNRVTGWDVGHG